MTAAAVEFAVIPLSEIPRSPKASPREIASAYLACQRIARAHYENFAVGSLLLPRRLRRHLAALYAFARTGDDLADEGVATPAERLERLELLEWALEEAYRGRPTQPVLVAVADTAARFAIPIAPFKRLLRAFRSDVEFRPFRTFADLRDYCRGSADPVGHLVLYLFGYRDEQRQALADRICTGLQLANLWQDVARDAVRGRVYVPLEDLARFGVSPEDLARGPSDGTRELLRFEVERARHHLAGGLELTDIVAPRLAREVRLFVGGGLAILGRIESLDYDVFARRPHVSGLAKLGLIARELSGTPPLAAVARIPRGAALPTGERSLGARREGYALRELPRSDGPRLEQAYAFCREVTRRSSSNFFHAFQLLAPAQRRALHAVYAFCRFVDDAADETSPRDPAEVLARWRAELTQVYEGEPERRVGLALADAVRRFGLERRHFEYVLRGVEMDLARHRYATFDELQEYCYLVASAVGLLCIEIFGYANPGARAYAVDLGLAFQMTNILRDVEEDARRGRIYLPLEDLGRFGVDEEELLAGRYSPRVAALLAFECGRARAFYLRARGTLPTEDRRSLAAAEAMRAIYERLLDRIEQRRFDVFGKRVTLSGYEKMSRALGGWARARVGGRGA